MSRAPLKPMIIALIKRGRTPREIASALRCSQNHVYSIRRSLGIYTEPKLTPDAVRKLARNDATQAEIARHFGVSAAAISNFVRRHEIVIRARWTRPDATRIARVRDMADRGFTQAEIGAAIGISGAGVCLFMARHDIAPSYGISRKRAGEVSPASPSIPDTTPHHSLTETEPFKHCALTGSV